MPSAHPATPDQSLLARVPMRVGGSFRYSPEQGEGGGEKPVEQPKAAIANAVAAAAPKVDTPPAETEADRIKRAVADALAAERARSAEAAQKAKEEADRLKAEEEGRWEELAKDNEDKFKKQKEENRKLRVRDALRDYLAEHHPERLKSAVDILPHVAADVDNDAIGPAVKLAAEGFIERNPSTPKIKAGGAPPAPPAGARVSTGRTPNHRNSTAGVASSRF